MKPIIYELHNMINIVKWVFANNIRNDVRPSLLQKFMAIWNVAHVSTVNLWFVMQSKDNLVFGVGKSDL